MATRGKAQEQGATIIVERVKTETITVALLGMTPLIMNRMAEKARITLLAGGQRKTAAEKQSTIKHDPETEYRNTAYIWPDQPTVLAMPTTAIKGAMMTAALDLPGTRKAQIGRLVWVVGEYVPIWGIPRLYMSVVRSADMSHTPDIRTRSIIPEWATLVSVTFVSPMLNATGIVNLLSASGLTAGIGDFRPEKGKGTFGQYIVVDPEDDRFSKIKTACTAELQQAALDKPEPYDLETARLLDLYRAEMIRRGKA